MDKIRVTPFDRKGYMVFVGAGTTMVFRAPGKRQAYSDEMKRRIHEMTGQKFEVHLDRYMAQYPDEAVRIRGEEQARQLRASRSSWLTRVTRKFIGWFSTPKAS